MPALRHRSAIHGLPVRLHTHAFWLILAVLALLLLLLLTPRSTGSSTASTISRTPDASVPASAR